ncbi:hypothetical protein [Paenibacillus ferrarius]|uniref:hypothetical protein n=1 Tax=Paenibacillus ferrarius TaxID=1469647 RepID=UPI00117C760E|nr:hypothetical protein [Paenibacillus ferrarius]
MSINRGFGSFSVYIKLVAFSGVQTYATFPNNLSITRRRIVDLPSHGSEIQTLVQTKTQLLMLEAKVSLVMS